MASMQTNYNSEGIEYAIRQIDDGTIFERFAQDLLCQILGLEFKPIGGTHDRGIDGLDRCFEPKGTSDTIYQISIERNAEAKIRKTIAALRKARKKFRRLVYVTNRRIPDQDVLEEKIFRELNVVLRCRDVAWLRGNVNKNEGTLRTFLTFVDSNYHSFATPGSSPILADFESDPRLCVFLRQQWESAGANARLDDVLVDSLILLALEGTDPDQGILMKRDPILDTIRTKIGFSSKVVDEKLDARLRHLSRKPRRIKLHKTGGYCLPYETRIELEGKNLHDAALHAAFRSGSEERLKAALKAEDVQVQDARALLFRVVNELFKKQGLEFANFVIKSEGQSAVEKSLDDIISEVVDDSTVVPKNRTSVKRALLAAMRDLIYRGTDEEIGYLRSLANSYMMLFLLQIDPKLATYFSTLAGRLRVFVDNSILVPAISEYHLDEKHRRHWNLLVNSTRSGVDLVISETALNELAAHFRKVLQRYTDEFAGNEEIYSDEEAIPYIDEILIRAYFYARTGGNTDTFEKFVDYFVSPGPRMEDELAAWLQGTFRIRVSKTKAPETSQFKANFKALREELMKRKKSEQQAANDARTILHIYQLREDGHESDATGIFGYKTWWLSTDVLTQKAVENCFGKRFKTSCYMRTDFLYNYITLTPSFAQSNEIFDVMFPSLLGVSVSHHIPPELAHAVRDSMRVHASYGAPRMKALLGTLAERLKTEPTAMSRSRVNQIVGEVFGQKSRAASRSSHRT
jgi:hypothetical protein